jgi:hypothetical protein
MFDPEPEARHGARSDRAHGRKSVAVDWGRSRCERLAHRSNCSSSALADFGFTEGPATVGRLYSRRAM